MRNNSGKPLGKGNFLVLAVIAVVALGLLAASRLLPSPHEALSQEDIQNHIDALGSPTEGPPSDGPTGPAEAQAEGYVFIIVNGRVWGIEPLGQERDVEIDQGNGVKNVVHIQQDGYYMASSTCDNQLCVTEGTVTLTNWAGRVLGPCVYCLPHQIQLELVVPNAEADPGAPDL